VIYHAGDRGGYTVNINLDEAYFDYNSEDMAALYAELGYLEQTEFAVFEPSSKPSFETPWVLIPQD